MPNDHLRHIPADRRELLAFPNKRLTSVKRDWHTRLRREIPSGNINHASRSAARGQRVDLRYYVRFARRIHRKISISLGRPRALSYRSSRDDYSEHSQQHTHFHGFSLSKKAGAGMFYQYAASAVYTQYNPRSRLPKKATPALHWSRGRRSVFFAVVSRDCRRAHRCRSI